MPKKEVSYGFKVSAGIVSLLPDQNVPAAQTSAESGSHSPVSSETLAHFAATALQSSCITSRMPDALFAIIISAYYLYHFLQRDFQRLLNKEDGQRAQWEYPFAVAGLNLSFMMVELLDLKAGVCTSS